MDTSTPKSKDAMKPIFTVDISVVCGEEVLMFRRSDTKKVFPGWLALPGGHIEAGEDPLSAAIREVHEEVGVLLPPTQVQLKFVAMHQHIDRNELFVVFGFLASVTTKPDVIVSSREGSATWMDKIQVMSKQEVFPPVKYYLPHMLGNKPGIIYNYSIWDDSQLVRVVSEKTDINS